MASRVGLTIPRSQRRQWLTAYKRSQGCLDCGTSEGDLHFDHRDKATKLFNIGRDLGRSWESVLAEIDKCDVRCKSCHIKRHQLSPQDSCSRGHVFTPENTYHNPRGFQVCRTCKIEWRAARRAALGAHPGERTKCDVCGIELPTLAGMQKHRGHHKKVAS